MLFGVYGGMMRGGTPTATVVVGDGPIAAPPLVSHTWSAIAHARRATGRRSTPKVRDGGGRGRERRDVRDARSTRPLPGVRVPATDIAAELGNALGGVDGDGRRVRGDHRARRPRRARRGDARSRSRRTGTQHVAANEGALRAGFDAASSRRPRRRGTRRCRHERCTRSRAAARSRSTSSAARAASCASRRARRACSTMSTTRQRSWAIRYPQLLPGCTGCAACLLVCPDFCFEVFRTTNPS